MSANTSENGKLDHEAIAAELRRFLDMTLSASHFDLRYRIDRREPAAAGAAELETPEIVVEFEGLDRDLLLERGAELLKALEHIAVRWLRLDRQFHERIQFDCGNFHSNRLAELKLSAEIAAQRVIETREPFRFNPMTPRERRVIHLVLKNHPGVRTGSEGQLDERHVVLFPAEPR